MTTDHPAVRALREALDYVRDGWPLVSSHITDRLQVVKETVATLEPWPVRTASPQGETQGQGEDDPSLRQAADLMYRHVALGEVVDADNWRRAARVLVAHANDTLRGSAAADLPRALRGEDS